MSNSREIPPDPLHAPHGSTALEYEEALEQLRLVNEIFVRSRKYRNLPGASGTLAGLLALVGGSFFSYRYGSVEAYPKTFLLTWFLIWFLALGTHLFLSVRNANRRLEPLFSEVGILLLQTILPALVIAAVLAFSLLQAEQVQLLPGLWILLYGMGVLACQPYVDDWIRWFGWIFIFLGSLHLLFFPEHPNLFMTWTFGLLHLAYGLWTAWSDSRASRKTL